MNEIWQLFEQFYFCKSSDTILRQKSDLHFSCLLCRPAGLCVMNEPCAGCSILFSCINMLNSITHPRTPVKSPQRWILRKAIADLRNTAGEVNAHTKAHKQTLCKCLVCPEAFELGKSERNEKQLAGSPKSRQKSALLFMADMRKYMTVRTFTAAHGAFAEGQI
jgi:hypothetical protein